MTNALPVVFDDGVLVVADPETGEAYPVHDAPSPVLARAAAYLDEILGDARRARTTLGDELKMRLGRDRRADLGTHYVERSDRREWDNEQTWTALSRLVDIGLVSSARVDEVMPAVTIRKPDGRRLGSLLTDLLGEAGEADAETLDAIQALARTRTTKTYVKVMPASVDATAAEVTA